MHTIIRHPPTPSVARGETIPKRRCSLTLATIVHMRCAVYSARHLSLRAWLHLSAALYVSSACMPPEPLPLSDRSVGIPRQAHIKAKASVITLYRRQRRLYYVEFQVKSCKQTAPDLPFSCVPCRQICGVPLLFNAQDAIFFPPPTTPSYPGG